MKNSGFENRENRTVNQVMEKLINMTDFVPTMKPYSE